MSGETCMNFNKLPILVKIKLFENAKLPQYKTSGSVCADCYCNLASDYISIPPFGKAKIPLGFALEIPEGYKVVVEPRSSLLQDKSGLNVHGEIDTDYRGQLMASVINLDPIHNMEIPNGERICQISIVPVYKMEFVQVNELSETERGEGGFGSTGAS